MKARILSGLILCLSLFATAGSGEAAGTSPLVRPAPVKKTLATAPVGIESGTVVFKLAEGLGQPDLSGNRFTAIGPQWDRLNQIVAGPTKAAREVSAHFTLDRATMNELREAAIARSGRPMPDLTLYHQLHFPPSATPEERIAAINELNALDIVEIAYYQPAPEPAGWVGASPIAVASAQLSPNWENNQYYLKAAPTGVDAYYAWNYSGGKGEGVKVIDIEGNWIQTHEDLKGGVTNFHIAGTRINDPGWYNHGTAVLGEIAADSNSFGMTGIAFDVNLGTISVGSMSTAQALLTAVANSDTGDVFLIELHAPGPHYNFESRDDQLGYIPMEYWQDTFDAILQASALGRIVIEAGGNGNENLDNVSIYGDLFDPSYRFSGAIMVGATSSSHVPASFTNYGQRVDVHAFGTWDVYTLGYGDLYGSSSNNHYTATFAGTSSASPIITGAAAVLQGLNKAAHGRILYHDEIRYLMQTFSTPQAPHSKHVGPLPDLRGAVDQVIGVSFAADTTVGWVPFDVSFEGSSGFEVSSWTWAFGDGDSAFVQSPIHNYDQAGLYTVSLQVEADGQYRTAQRTNYIIALADSLIPSGAQAAAGDTVEVLIRGRNITPLRIIDIPIEYPGDLPMSFAGYSTDGCRTDYFEIKSLSSEDPVGRRLSIRLTSSTGGTSPALEPGEGPLLKVRFVIEPTADPSQSATIVLDGYSTYLPKFTTTSFTYNPLTPVSATVTVCPPHGDVDPYPGITVSDLTYMVNFLFRQGLPPSPLETGDANCDGKVAVSDLTFLVNYLFKGGAEPCTCL